ncbi:cation diffusion facilitator family transporter [Parvibaculaceae bacterium PLY_AMNH_Bact1]|nr:cation diffusion facilitator family transporter [Parvibaculaceae bacterium PLY_AMNH_Bact1]
MSHAHSDNHEHDHGSGHSHAPDVNRRNQRRVLAAMCLTAGFMVAEVIGGLLSGSLALIADAGHMATDAAALFLAYIAFRFSNRPADADQSYGYHRAETLAAFVNALTMIALVTWILFEAVQRFFDPVEILGGLMLWVAAGGLVVNVLAFWLLHSGEKENLNMQGAAVHVLGDLLGSVAAIAAAIVILYTGWTPIDPLLSVFVALLILRSAIALARQSGHILMEGTPKGLDIEEIKQDLLNSVAGVEDVHHLHAWSLTATRDVMTLHARIAEGINPDQVLVAINDRLRHKFQIDHATVQIETGACAH